MQKDTVRQRGAVHTGRDLALFSSMYMCIRQTISWFLNSLHKPMVLNVGTSRVKAERKLKCKTNVNAVTTSVWIYIFSRRLKKVIT